MSSLSSPVAPQKETVLDKLSEHLNFYRVHLLFFTFTPLIFSGIFFASNGRYKISYMDSLFNCFSAMTVCGLASVNLSSLTGFQQSLLFVLMCLGNPVFISWNVVYMRRYFFAKKFESIMAAEAAKNSANIMEDVTKKRKPWPRRLIGFFSAKRLSSVDVEIPKGDPGVNKIGIIRKLRPDMIRRMDDAPQLINPSGWLSEGQVPSARKKSIDDNRPVSPALDKSNPDNEPSSSKAHGRRRVSIDFADQNRIRRLSDPGLNSSRSPSPSLKNMQRYETVTHPLPDPSLKRFPRAQTVEFAPPPLRPDKPSHFGMQEQSTLQDELQSMRLPDTMSGHGLHHSPSISNHTHRVLPETNMTRGFGGFPSPFSILKNIVARFFPGVKRTLTRTVTIPATMSLTPHVESQSGKKQVTYISFEARVGRNSAFHLLTNEQLNEIGGVEYRTLNALLWILAFYHIFIQLIAFTVIAPYMYLDKWIPIFDSQVRSVNRIWFSAFQVVSAYTNTGTSLVDQSMVPFQKAYPMIFAVMFLILAGNTSFPIFLRFMIWCLSKIFPKSSRMNETLHFLLDHPRRCFIYLFPSHQTWFLLTIVLTLTCIDWFFCLILDLSNSAMKAIPAGVRVLDCLMQGVAVRAAGFSILPLAVIAPAVKVLYVVMMYISAYPIALSVRSTNVYEEQSLGIFHPNEHDSVDEQTFEPSGPRVTVWSRYLAMHARRQLAFDMWWLAISLFLICIVEQSNLTNPENYGWFDIFRITFEIVSAYGTVGLSLGVPYDNYSFCGAMHTLSKLILCLVMLRGRHRGLPVAIDRAVMLPSEFEKSDLDRRSQFSTTDMPFGRHFTQSDTMNSHHMPDVRHRTRRHSRISVGDETAFSVDGHGTRTVVSEDTDRAKAT